MTKILSALAVVVMVTAVTSIAVSTPAEAKRYWKKKWVYPWGPYWGHGAVVYRPWGGPWGGPGPGPGWGGPGWWW